MKTTTVIAATAAFVLTVTGITLLNATHPGTPTATATTTTAPTVGTPPRTATSKPSGAEAAVTLRVAHSPGAIDDDMHLQPGQCHIRVLDQVYGLVLPDPACTPGGIDPAVTQENLSSTICRAGYTKMIRPPAAITNRYKTTALVAYSLPYEKTTEYDHLVSLELGGTNTTSNLFPEPNRTGATTVNNPKDLVENRLNRAVCAHRVTLAAAQHAIATDWTTAEASLGLPTSNQKAAR